jgi:hypothetical protein
VVSGSLFGVTELPVERYEPTSFVDMGYAVHEGQYDVRFELQLASGASSDITQACEVSIQPCLPGEVLEGTLETGTRCVRCLKSFTSAGGNASCIACPVGHLKYMATLPSDDAGGICGPCDNNLMNRLVAADNASGMMVGHVRDNSSSSDCNMCIGSDDVDDEDQNPRGYYLKKDQRCDGCPEGANCTNSGTTLSSLVSVEGWWRVGQHDPQFFACPYEGDCQGGVIVSNPSDQCRRGHTGTLCAVCLPSHVRIDGHCEHCESGDSSDGFVYIALIVLFLTGLVFLCFMTRSAKYKRSLERQRSRKTARDGKSLQELEHEALDVFAKTGNTASASARLYSKFRIIIGFAQINAAMNLGFDVPWREYFCCCVHAIVWSVLENFNCFKFLTFFLPIPPLCFCNRLL